MPSIHRALLGGACAVSLLAGCNFNGGSSTSSGSATFSDSVPVTTGPVSSAAPPSGLATGTTATPAADSVVATPSVVGTVTVLAGASETITVAFTSADGRPISGLALSNTTLPTGWSAPSDFTCTVTGSGNNCVLTLTYAPTAVETGTLKIGYVYVGDQTPPPGSSLSIPYAATTTNNVVATAAPLGQINAESGTGTRSVSVNFTTDDGDTATNLTVSSLASLPAGWSTTTPGFSCGIISNGNGCQLTLKYAPSAAGHDTLTLNYGYTDHSGATRTGAINLPYAATTSGNVVATVSPTGQINAIQKAGTQTVTITFTTDDGKAASGLALLSALSSLPGDWSSATGRFTCGSVSTGNACQLKLNYTPTALKSGTVQLEYGYTSPTGTFTTGSFDIPYSATTNDNVVATAAPSGEIDAIVGEVSPSVLVAFATDDARTATALKLTTDLATLPAGWSSTDSSFSCTGVGSAGECDLPLTYAPGAADSGTMTLRYTYLNNAGQPKSGSVSVPYRATTDDNVLATPNVSSLAALTATSTAVTISFNTDDGNPASALSVTSGLDSLPVGWSSAASTLACTSISSGVSCQLPLNYQPVVADSGTLTIAYTYTNDAGSIKSGTVAIPYSAAVPPPPPPPGP